MEQMKKFIKRWFPVSAVTIFIVPLFLCLQTFFYEQFIMWRTERLYIGSPRGVLGLTAVYDFAIVIFALLFIWFWKNAFLLLLDIKAKKIVKNKIFVNDCLELKYEQKHNADGLPVGYYVVKGVCDNGKKGTFFIDTDIHRFSTTTADVLEITHYKYSKIATSVKVLDSQPRKYKTYRSIKKYGVQKGLNILFSINAVKVICVFILCALVSDKMITLVAPTFAETQYSINSTVKNLYTLCLSLSPTDRNEEIYKYYGEFVYNENFFNNTAELTEFDTEDICNIFIAEYVEASYETQTKEVFIKDLSNVILLNDGIYSDNEEIPWRYLKERMVDEENTTKTTEFLTALHIAYNNPDISSSKRISGYQFILSVCKDIGDMDTYNDVLNDLKNVKKT